MQAEDFERHVAMSKLSELTHMLVRLGAKSIHVEMSQDDSHMASQHVSLQLPEASVGAVPVCRCG